MKTFTALAAGWMVATAPLARAQTLNDPHTAPLDATLLELAETRHLQLAYAPELLVNKRSGCRALPEDNTAAILCVLEGTGLEVDASAGNVYVIYRPSAMKPFARAGIGSGSISGAVHAAADNQPLPGAHVQIAGFETGAASGPDGRYTVTPIPVGEYDVVVSMVGFKPQRIEGVHVRPGQTVTLDAHLDEATFPLDEVIVTSRQQSEPGRLDLGPVSVGAQDVRVGSVSAGILFSARPEPMRGIQVGGIASFARDTLDGIQISGILNTAVHPSQGLQVGGILNVIDGSLDGIQVSGLVNGLTAGLAGVQVAGLANYANGSMRGLQASGALNRASGTLTGVQVGGALNTAGDMARGVQAAGAMNLAWDVHGVQISGAINVAGRVLGTQVAGIANIANGDLMGTQISLVNVAGATHGAQIGLVNVARSLDGFPLGLVSYVQDYGFRYDVLVDETGTVSTILRSGNQRFANYIGYSARPDGFRASASSLVGLGVVLVRQERLYQSIDALYQASSFDNSPTEQRVQLRALFGFHAFRFLDIVAGPTLNLLLDDNDTTRLPIPWQIESGQWGGTTYAIWPGLAFGVRLSTRG